ncbi:MAG TPA: hypothetical protein ENI52_05635 [Thermoplasmata archaeon]|nr:hypothetical protein [Thermoplasmata archaeon]
MRKQNKNKNEKKLENEEKNYISAIQKEIEIISKFLENNTNTINKLRNFYITIIAALLGLSVSLSVYGKTTNEGILNFFKSNPSIIVILIIVTVIFAFYEGVVTSWQILHINRIAKLNEIVEKELNLSKKLKKYKIFIDKDVYKENNKIKEKDNISRRKMICEIIKSPSFFGFYIVIFLVLIGSLWYLMGWKPF